MMMTVVVVLWLVRAFRQQDSISLYISLSLSLYSFPVLYCSSSSRQKHVNIKKKKKKKKKRLVAARRRSLPAAQQQQAD